MTFNLSSIANVRLDDQVALVTGSVSGLGFTIASHLGRRGAKIIVNSRSEERALAGAKSLLDDDIEAIGIAADVSDPIQVESMMEAALQHFGRVDILVNNAGIGSLCPAEDMPSVLWNEIIGTNLTGPFLCAQAAARSMLKQRSGVIINISSIYGQTANVQRAAYVAAKHGLDGLTKALAIEWADRGIRVCSVNPGYILTPMLETTLKTGSFSDAELKQRTPMGRLANAEEIAEAVAYLSSPAASFITGAQLPVDGGWLSYGGF